MSSPNTSLVGFLIVWALATTVHGQTGDTTKVANTSDVSMDTTLSAWVDSVWTQVDDMVREVEHRLQPTVTTSGVRGAESEESLLDRLGYVSARRPPSREDLRRAIGTLSEALRASPKAPEAAAQYYLIAQCHQALGDRSAAIKQYQLLVGAHPQSGWAVKAATELMALADSALTPVGVGTGITR